MPRGRSGRSGRSHGIGHRSHGIGHRSHFGHHHHGIGHSSHFGIGHHHHHRHRGFHSSSGHRSVSRVYIPPPRIPNAIFTIERLGHEIAVGCPDGCNSGGNEVRPDLLAQLPAGLNDIYTLSDWQALARKINELQSKYVCPACPNFFLGIGFFWICCHLMCQSNLADELTKLMVEENAKLAAQGLAWQPSHQEYLWQGDLWVLTWTPDRKAFEAANPHRRQLSLEPPPAKYATDEQLIAMGLLVQPPIINGAVISMGAGVQPMMQGGVVYQPQPSQMVMSLGPPPQQQMMEMGQPGQQPMQPYYGNPMAAPQPGQPIYVQPSQQQQQPGQYLPNAQPPQDGQSQYGYGAPAQQIYPPPQPGSGAGGHMVAAPHYPSPLETSAAAPSPTMATMPSPPSQSSPSVAPYSPQPASSDRSALSPPSYHASAPVYDSTPSKFGRCAQCGTDRSEQAKHCASCGVAFY